jgi:tRNA pseudouridine55 synthase
VTIDHDAESDDPSGPAVETDAPRPDRDRGQRRPPHDRPKKRVVNGWVVLDKPVGMTSTFAVAAVKRALNAKKAGHAGTLDPLASGILPIALGEATKTVPYVMDGRKSYVFTVAWGVETDTDDAEGKPVQATNRAPAREEIEALLPRFTGTIEQVPPRFSAVKIAGERAYDLARDGEEVELKARTVQVDRLAVVAHDGDRSVIEADCGKGTYVRALARDLGRAHGCLGHVSALRRTRVGPFSEANATTVGDLEAAGAQEGGLGPLLHPVATALCDLAAVPVSRDAAGRLMRGQPVILRGRDAPAEGRVYATFNGALVAVGDVENGELVPHRVFSLGG